MNDPKPSIRDALLQQEGLAIGPLSAERRKELEMLVAREQARVRRMRWITAALWILLVVMHVFWWTVGAAGEGRWRRFESIPMAVLGVITMALFPMAVLSTISLYVRWQIASRHALDFRLRSLEDQIARLRQQD